MASFANVGGAVATSGSLTSRSTAWPSQAPSRCSNACQSFGPARPSVRISTHLLHKHIQAAKTHGTGGLQNSVRAAVWPRPTGCSALSPTASVEAICHHQCRCGDRCVCTSSCDAAEPATTSGRDHMPQGTGCDDAPSNTHTNTRCVAGVSVAASAASAACCQDDTTPIEAFGRPPGAVPWHLLQALIRCCQPVPTLALAWAGQAACQPAGDPSAPLAARLVQPSFTSSNNTGSRHRQGRRKLEAPQGSASSHNGPEAADASSPDQPISGLASSSPLPSPPRALLPGDNAKAGEAGPPDLGTLWGLLVLALAYLHHSTTGFAVPALLPLISPDLQLTDFQGSLLTVGYTVLYAVALVPVGFLADKADRPRLLAGGLAAWSLLTMTSSKVHGFAELLATRVGFAAAQATQNPICFSLIPELFPRQRTTAMAAYNSAIYMGRALSFAAVIVAGKLGVAHGDIGVTMVPLNSLDLSHVSILYTQGEMAAITPIYDYDFRVLHGQITESSWRQLLYWLGPPGLFIAACSLFTLDEPRKPSGGMFGDPLSSSRFTNPTTRGLNRSPDDTFGLAGGALARAAEKQAAAKAARDKKELMNSVKALVGSRAFQMVTLAAAVNDIGSWALVSWHATFYQRVYDLGPDVYAPALAAIIPIGGIIGGVGGGLCGDWLTRIGGRFWLTAGASIACAPLIAGSLLANEYTQSFAALLVGFALSEAWRAPAAIMVRDVSPPNLGSTGSAVHLCIRNLVGGSGPLAVAYLSAKVGLQHAMLLVPSMYLLSGLIFFFAERVAVKEAEDKRLASSTAANK